MDNERFYNISQFPFEKTKEFMKSLYSVLDCWTIFDKLDCSVSFARQNDPGMNFETYIDNATPSWIPVCIVGRKEYCPKKLEEIAAISVLARANLIHWRIPDVFEHTLKKAYGEKLYNWEFFQRKNIIPEAYARWKKLHNYKNKIVLPDALSKNLPEKIAGQLPDDLKEFVRRDKESFERFYWWFCPDNKQNYQKFRKLFRQAYSSDLDDAIMGAGK